MISLSLNPVWGRQGEHGPISSAGPGVGRDRVQQCLSFPVSEEGDFRFGMFLDGDRVNSRDGVQQLRCLGGLERRRRFDGREPKIPGCNAVSAVILEVVEECDHLRCVDVGGLELVGWHVLPLGEEGQEELPGVAVSPNRRGTHGALSDQMRGEELLQDRSEQRRHGCLLGSRSRTATAAISGAACRYQ